MGFDEEKEKVISHIMVDAAKGFIKHHGIKGQKWGVKNGPPYPLKGFENANSLSDHMKTFKYKEFDRLMSPDEVENTKTGSCHDQVMYEFRELRKMGKDPKGLFVIECDYNDLGGDMHSLVYYDENGKTNWFENAWKGREGVSQYSSLDDIKNEITKAHENGEFGNSAKYGKLYFGEFMDTWHTPGETLQDFVDCCFEEPKIH